MVAITEFGKELRGLRARLNISQKQLAFDLYYTPSYLSAIESGKRRPTMELVNKIFDTYVIEEENAREVLELAIKRDEMRIRDTQRQVDEYKKRLASKILDLKLSEQDCDNILAFLAQFKS